MAIPKEVLDELMKNGSGPKDNYGSVLFIRNRA